MKKIGLTVVVLELMLMLMLFGSLFGSFSSAAFSNDIESESDIVRDKIGSEVLDAFLDSESEIELVINIVDSEGKAPYGEFDSVERVIDEIDEERVLDYYYDVIVAELSYEELIRVVSDRNVESVGLNNVRFDVVLEEVVPLVGADGAWDYEIDGEYLTGGGQTVYVIDTGIDFTHQDLSDKNILGNILNCFEPFGTEPCFPDSEETDWNGHGTHVAGIAAAAEGEGIPGGIAKGANLIGAKVFPGDSDEGAEFIDVRRAIDYAVDHAEEYEISVISMSIGDDFPHPDYCDDLPSFASVRNGINRAVEDNIAVVVATGNDGSSTGINAPACLSNAIPVGATNKDDTLAHYSNYWNIGNILFFPGTSVRSTCAASDGDEGEGSVYCTKTGTSMSTPGVAGTIAILNQMEPRTMHPKEEIEPLLFETSDLIVGMEYENWRRVDVKNAVVRMFNEVPADLNMNGVVDSADLGILLGEWGDCEGYCVADFDRNRNVDAGDLAVVLANWS